MDSSFLTQCWFSVTIPVFPLVEVDLKFCSHLRKLMWNFICKSEKSYCLYYWGKVTLSESWDSIPVSLKFN